MFVNCSKRIGRLNEEAVELEHHRDSGLVQRIYRSLSKFINVRVDEPIEQAIMTYS